MRDQGTVLHRVGVDENGLGPRLGPLVVTGALLTVPSGDGWRAVMTSAGIGDSKGLCSHGAMGEVESLVLALLDAELGLRPRDFDALLEALLLGGRASLFPLCPAGESPRACHGHPLALPAYGPGVTSASRSAARSIAFAGVRVRALRSSFACARALHLARDAGQSRFDVDLARMAELVGALRKIAGTEVEAVCGKVGGRNRYAAGLESLGALCVTLDEGAGRSSYRFPGVGTVSFVRDADADDPAVGLASLVGKYLRELAMTRMQSYYAEAIPGIDPASGYHDPVTTRWIAATSLLRRERAIEDRCFER